MMNLQSWMMIAVLCVAACGDDAGRNGPESLVLPEAPVGQWQTQAGGTCRNGSMANFRYRYGSVAKLVIFLDGGGACFNTITCVGNSDTPSDRDLDAGVGDLTNEDNPFKDWHHVFVPYCTGDVHAGVRPDQEDPAVLGTQQFVGFNNMQQYLGFLTETFSNMEQVVLAGASAGGFGAILNFVQVQEAFGVATPVVMLNDSGPPLSDAYLAPCLQKRWRELWGLSESFPTGCDDCASQDNGGGVINYLPYITQTYPNAQFGILSYLQDETTRFFYSFGQSTCAQLDVPLLQDYPGDAFEDGLFDLRNNWMVGEQWGSYFANGTAHTFLGSDKFYTSEVDGARLVDWVQAMLDGNPSHVGP